MLIGCLIRPHERAAAQATRTPAERANSNQRPCRLLGRSLACSRARAARSSYYLLYLARILARLCGSLVRACGRACRLLGRSLACSRARAVVGCCWLCGRACRLRGRSLVRSLVDVGSLVWLARADVRACGRACRLLGRSLARSSKTCLIRRPICTVT